MLKSAFAHADYPMLNEEALKIQIDELSLIKAMPVEGPTRLVEVMGRTDEGRLVVVSIHVERAQALLRALASAIRA